MIVALASPRVAPTFDEGLQKVEWLVSEASARGASVNYALRFPESATSLIDPTGRCQAYLPYGQEGLLVQAIDVAKATGLLATRYAPDRYREGDSE